MRRIVGALVLGVGLTALAAVPAFAGGGGCHAASTDGQGTTVHIRDFCFGPTVLHVKTGDTITWVNDDVASHTVTGSSMSFGDYTEVAAGKRVSYRFATPGAYPYYCFFHPGMVGTLVVGDGSGPGAAGASTIEPLGQRVPPAPAVHVAATVRVPASTSPNLLLMLLLVVVFGAVVGGATWLGRRAGS